MNLSVLGRCGPYPRAHEACSGYLLSSGETSILIECGAGTLSRLRSLTELSALDAIVLSHLHYDHCADMAILRYALEQSSHSLLPVYCPAEPNDARAIFDYPVFQIHPLQNGMELCIGSVVFSFCSVRHPVPTFGFCAKGAGASLFYTGDTGWFEELPALVHGADALLCDCCFTDVDIDKPAIHLTARQAGELAKQARVKTLYCTHLWGGASDDEAILREVSFSPSVVVQEQCTYDLSS